ncbi:MAG: cupin [Candidatus Omnitrophica bacterium]|nr:cupin [Candidatus Omnitrophota bacterium]
MPAVLVKPTLIKACGNQPKIIQEFIGHVNSQTSDLSVAMMESPEGWKEPGQTPEFDEYTLVLEGTLQVETSTEKYLIGAGQAIIAFKGEWVRYSSPKVGGAKYIAVCHPAFHPETVHRDAEV